MVAACSGPPLVWVLHVFGQERHVFKWFGGIFFFYLEDLLYASLAAPSPANATIGLFGAHWLMCGSLSVTWTILAPPLCGFSQSLLAVSWCCSGGILSLANDLQNFCHFFVIILNWEQINDCFCIGSGCLLITVIQLSCVCLSIMCSDDSRGNISGHYASV